MRWLDYPKGDDHWAPMLLFLDKSYEQANQELALLSVYNKHKRKDVKSAGVHVDFKGGSDENNDERKEAKKRRESHVGNALFAISSTHGKERMGPGGRVTESCLVKNLRI